MFLGRDIMYCKPGKVRSMVDKLKAMRKVSEKQGLGFVPHPDGCIVLGR
jgi:hypothetical protein